MSPTVSRRLFTTEEFRRMAEAGLLREDDRLGVSSPPFSGRAQGGRRFGSREAGGAERVAPTGVSIPPAHGCVTIWDASEVARRSRKPCL
jgi:hypothetical protein